MVSARRYVVPALFTLVCFGVTLLLGSSGVAQQPSGRPQADTPTTDGEGKPLPGTSIPCAPDGAMPGRAGDRVVVRGNLPMILHATGTEIRRNFALVLHDATQPASARVDNWTPKGLCK
jgi:hypothetical protein